MTITEKISSVPLRSTPNAFGVKKARSARRGGGVLSSELKLGGMTIIFEPKASRGQRKFLKVR